MDNKCGCGCGEPVKYKYVKGHFARVVLRERFLSNSLERAKRHPDCYKLNPESKCRLCKIKKELNNAQI